MKTWLFPCFFILALLAGDITHAQTPRLNSYPGAAATVFLNFDGELVSGTAWNWSGPINAEPAALPASDVIEIFNRVAEDYRPFNINITTDPAVYAAAPFTKRTHLVVTPSWEWYGRAGGVAYVGSFNWGDDTPAWVFSSLLFNNPKNVAEACSHEAGHTLGLQHQSAYSTDCVKTAEYNAGQGTGEIGWAPIMGVGYSKNLTTWHIGSSTVGCGIIQNDMEMIAGGANNIGYRTDDHGDTLPAADSIVMQGEQFEVNGIINRMTDTDLFKLRLSRSSRFRLNAVPQNVGSGNQGANIDLKIYLLNAAADTLGSYNPSTLLNAGVDTGLQTGTYYIAVTGTGNTNHTDYGSVGLYALAGSLLNILPVQQFELKGIGKGGRHILSWTVRTDEPIQTLGIEWSDDAIRFRPLATAGLAASPFSCQSPAASVYYRLKVTGVRGAFYSNIVHLADNEENSIGLLPGIVKDQIIFNSSETGTYAVVDATGQTICKGQIIKGGNHVNIQQAPAGILFFRLAAGTRSQVRKLIKQ